MNEGEKKVREYIRQQIKEQLGIEKSNLNEDQKSKKLLKVDKIIAEQLKLYESANVDESLNVPYSLKGMLAKVDPNDENKIERLFTKTFHNDLADPRMRAVAGVAQATPTANKLEILQQYADGGGTLGISDQNALTLVPRLA